MATELQLKTKEHKTLSSYQIIAYNLTKAKAKILKFFLKAFGVNFKVQEPYPYGPQFEKDMKEAEEDFKEGRFYKLKDVKNMWSEDAWEKSESWK